MSKVESHFSFSTGLAVIYAIAGILLFNLSPEVIFLSAVVLVIAGILPNIDEDNSIAAEEFSGLFAAISPLVFFELFPSVQHAGISKIVLLVICSYTITKIIIGKILLNFTVHRGMFHSIPAAILTSEIIYLLFWDLQKIERLYVSSAALIGFLMHLVMDGYGNLDLVSRAMGKGVSKKPPALKIWGDTPMANLVIYTGALALGWFVLKDISPGFQLSADIKY